MKRTVTIGKHSWRKIKCGNSNNINIVEFPQLFAQKFLFLSMVFSLMNLFWLHCTPIYSYTFDRTTHPHAHNSYYDNEKWIWIYYMSWSKFRGQNWWLSQAFMVRFHLQPQRICFQTFYRYIFRTIVYHRKICVFGSQDIFFYFQRTCEIHWCWNF